MLQTCETLVEEICLQAFKCKVFFKLIDYFFLKVAVQSVPLLAIKNFTISHAVPSNSGLQGDWSLSQSLYMQRDAIHSCTHSAGTYGQFHITSYPKPLYAFELW